MSSCCTTDDANVIPCPECGTVGAVVGAAPVRAHRPKATEGAWQYCATAGCRVVYYLGDEVVDDSMVLAQVGLKATDEPTPVCFCFAHTPTSLADDLLANDGVSTAKAAIKNAVAEGHCACEHLNPSSRCCLPDIRRALKTIEQNLVTNG